MQSNENQEIAWFSEDFGYSGFTTRSKHKKFTWLQAIWAISLSFPSDIDMPKPLGIIWFQTISTAAGRDAGNHLMPSVDAKRFQAFVFSFPSDMYTLTIAWETEDFPHRRTAPRNRLSFLSEIHHLTDTRNRMGNWRLSQSLESQT